VVWAELDAWREFSFESCDPRQHITTSVILLMAMKRPGTAILICALFGAMSLLSMASKGRLEAIRGVDVVRLIGIGMCFGAALAGLVAILRKRV